MLLSLQPTFIYHPLFITEKLVAEATKHDLIPPLTIKDLHILAALLCGTGGKMCQNESWIAGLET